MNHFEDVLEAVQEATPTQRCDKLIEGIAKQLSTNGAQQLAQELRDKKPDFVQAFMGQQQSQQQR